MSYDSLNADFGPVNLASFFRSFHALHDEMLKIQQQQQQESAADNNSINNKRLVIISSTNCYVVHNVAAVVAAFCIVVLNLEPQLIKKAFEDAHSKKGLPPFLPFRDAGVGPSNINLTMNDVIDAFVVARKHRWFPVSFKDPLAWKHQFDIDHYEEMYDQRNAYCNVIVPDLFLAFASPKDEVDGDGIDWSASRLLPYFKKHHVRLVIRLSETPDYSDIEFRKHGIQCESIFFDDGGIPSDAHVRKFFDTCNSVFHHYAHGPEEEVPEKTAAEKRKERHDALLFKDQTKEFKMQQKLQLRQRLLQQKGGSGSGAHEQQTTSRSGKKVKGAVGVHCAQGLGRTAVMIALFCMHKYKCTAREIITWLRICRPGSVVGLQQHYLVTMESRLLASHFCETPPSNLLPKVASRKKKTLTQEEDEREKEKLLLSLSSTTTTTASENENDSDNGNNNILHENAVNGCMLHPRSALTSSSSSSRQTRFGDDDGTGHGYSSLFSGRGTSAQQQQQQQQRPQSSFSTTNRTTSMMMMMMMNSTTTFSQSRPGTAATNKSSTSANNFGGTRLNQKDVLHSSPLNSLVQLQQDHLSSATQSKKPRLLRLRPSSANNNNNTTVIVTSSKSA